MVPETPLGLLKLIVAIAFPEQTVCVAGAAVTVGIGVTVTSTVTGIVEIQPSSEVAYSVNVVVCAVLVVLLSVPEIGEPLPLAAIPVTFAVLFLVQL